MSRGKTSSRLLPQLDPKWEAVRSDIRTERPLRTVSVVILVFAALTACETVYPQGIDHSADSSSSSQPWVQVKSTIDDLLRRHAIAGAAIALVSGDSILAIDCFGFADVRTQTPVAESTLFCVGSCTKSFLGLGYLKLLERGLIDIHAPVRDVAPEIAIDNPWRDSDPVRIVHLLEHTSGFDDMHLNSLYNDTDPEMPLDSALLLRPNARTVRWQPGTRYAYSSPGFTLAGYILEKAANQRYEEFLKEAVLEPIGMVSSTFRHPGEYGTLLATGYADNGKPLPYIQGYDRPSSSLISSIRDMALFVQFLINMGKVNGEQIFDDSLIDQMGRPTTTVAAREGLMDGYSFGLGVRFRDGFKWFGHSGGGPGFIARYSYLKDHRLGYVVLANCFKPQEFQGLCEVVRRYLIRELDATPGPSRQTPAELLQRHCGYYESCSTRQQLVRFLDVLFGGITITLENDTLYEREFMSDKEALVPVSNTRFRKLSEPDASRIFITSPSGKKSYSTLGAYYERTGSWKRPVFRTLFLSVLVIMASTPVYAIVWVPVRIFKVLRKYDNRSKYPRMRVIPLFAVLSLVMGVWAVSSQDMLGLGQRTAANVAFFVSTLAFAGLSMLSLLVAVKSFSKPVKRFSRIYCLTLSSACVGMTLYLWYWGIIGLRLWAY